MSERTGKDDRIDVADDSGAGRDKASQIKALESEVAKLKRALARAERRIKKLTTLAYQDSLLPVLNRRAFVRELTRVAGYGRRYGAANCLVYFDLNDLKTINDAYAHDAGDEALRRVASVLLDETRDSDIIGRLGGDEIGLVLVRVDEAVATRKAAELAAKIASKPMLWRDRKIAVTVAYGVHPIGENDSAEDAIHRADQAMYARKAERGDDPALR